MTKPSDTDIRVEILRQVTARGADKTICPSDVARTFGADWRDLMPAVRELAADLVADGRIVVTQKGKVVDISTARGPVRLGLRGPA